MTRIATLVERHTASVIAAIAVVFAMAYASSLVIRPKPDGRIVIGDALHHYVQLRSLVFDRDLHFQNEYVRMYRLHGGEPGTEWVYESTPTGYVRNLMPVGPALLWAPAFLVTTLLVWTGQLVGWNYPLDGYGRLFQATAGLTGVVAAALGVWFSYLASAELVGRRAAAWASIVLWLSSSAVYYSVISPTYSHAASLLTTSLFWLAFVRGREQDSLRRYVMLGALAGIAALMRWQDAIILAVPCVDLLWRCMRGLRIGQVVTRGLACVAAALVAFTPQMLVWQTIYGRPFAIPQGEGFMQWSSPALAAVLFSDWHGLFTWTPVVAVAVAGLAFLWRRDRLVCSAAVTFLVLSWYVNASAADWWAGEAFGSRRFVSCFAVFCFGLGAVIQRLSLSPKAVSLAAGATVAYTFLLLVQYQAFMHGLRDVVPYPRGAFNLWLARFVVPFDLLARWWGHA
jgi:hypothetical protein